jgi:hypothetical protein
MSRATPRNDENAARSVRQTSVCRWRCTEPRLGIHDKLKFVGHFRRSYSWRGQRRPETMRMDHRRDACATFSEESEG